MNIQRVGLPGMVVFSPDVYGDNRGWFSEKVAHYHNMNLVQINSSFSNKGVIRGLHIQPNTAKLIWVVQGSIYDLAYDDKTLLSFGMELSAANGKQLLIPAGYHHGFQALEDNTIVMYAMDKEYDPKNESGLNPFVFKNWPLSDPIVSKKDSSAPIFYEN